MSTFGCCRGLLWNTFVACLLSACGKTEGLFSHHNSCLTLTLMPCSQRTKKLSPFHEERCTYRSLKQPSLPTTSVFLHVFVLLLQFRVVFVRDVNLYFAFCCAFSCSGFLSVEVPLLRYPSTFKRTQ